MDSDEHNMNKVTILEETKRDGNTMVKCACRCGKVFVTRKARILSGETKSCGCLQKKLRKRRGWNQ